MSDSEMWGHFILMLRNRKLGQLWLVGRQEQSNTGSMSTLEIHYYRLGNRARRGVYILPSQRSRNTLIKKNLYVICTVGEMARQTAKSTSAVHEHCIKRDHLFPLRWLKVTSQIPRISIYVLGFAFIDKKTFLVNKQLGFIDSYF